MRRLKMIARQSPLSQAQVHELMALIPDVQCDVQVLETMGDFDQTTSLRCATVSSDFFTRELDQMIINGEADIAVHSAKDLPQPLPNDLRVVALLPCYDSTDALVTQDNLSLQQLPAGACVATSSESRQEALLKLRSDLTFKDIRGTIEQRIAQIDQGYADAVVVATCALKRLGLNHRIAEVLAAETTPLQGHLAVVARRHRPDIAKLMAPLDIRRSFGKVYLAGFGPGDPELMTLKTDRVLKQADVILYDDLIDDSVLTRYEARAIYVGKRKGQHYRSQKEINQLMKHCAWQGKTVVRLKGGDPCIFGRVGEEVEWLKQWMVPYEIIPGVTSAMAAAASQNISLTQRGISKTFSFLTGHHAKQRKIEVPSVDTIVYFMAASELETLSRRLVEEGRSADEPVLLVQNATFANEQSELTTVRDLAKTRLGSPLMVIVGDVTAHATVTPKVLYTGLDASRYKSPYKVVAYPLICTKPFNDVIARQNEVITKQSSHSSSTNTPHDAIIFTSREAVKYFFQKAHVGSKSVIAIGQGTQDALQERGIRVDHMPKQADSNHLLELIQTLPYQSYLYPCSSLSNNALHEQSNITPWVIYTTETVLQDKLNLDDFDRIVFTSPSTVDSFLAIYEAIPNHVLCEVLGPFTKQRLLEVGVGEERVVGM